MSDKNISGDKDAKRDAKSNRSPRPNPFISYLSSSPNISPRSEASSSSASASPRSPNQSLNGKRIPISPNAIPSSFLTAGFSKLISFC